MATIKSFTDTDQSKKLAEILPLESADMCYRYYSGGMITGYGDCVLAKSFITGKNVIRENDLPCWSFAALLDILPEYNLQRTNWGNKTEYKIVVTINNYDDDYNYASKNYDNPLDACVDIIERLHELNLI